MPRRPFNWSLAPAMEGEGGMWDACGDMPWCWRGGDVDSCGGEDCMMAAMMCAPAAFVAVDTDCGCCLCVHVCVCVCVLAGMMCAPAAIVAVDSACGCCICGDEICVCVCVCVRACMHICAV